MATGGDKLPSLDADVDMVDLASLDAPAASSAAAAGARSTRFRPRAKLPKPKPEPPKPVPVAVPSPEPAPAPELVPVPEPEPEAAPAAPSENDRVDAMEVDRAGDAAAVGERAEAEEDFVVREINVYYTPKPFDDDTKLYIMQYPLRPCWRRYEFNEICEEVRVKPLSSEVEVDLSVDTQSENYDQEAPLRLTKQTLSSSKADGVSDYVVGVLKGNLVYLNHIDAVVQLRPSMSHVISGRAHTRQALQSRETNGGVSGSKAPSRKGDDRPEDSKDHHTEDSEPWISLTYQPAGSNIATKYHDKMISNVVGPIDFTMSNSDYVMSLCPGASTSSKHVNKCQAIREMHLLPLEERLKKWFTEVSEVNQFDALKHLAPTYSEEEIFKLLPEYAYLVRGLWVCKSSLLFDDGYALKRDRVLLEFTKSESIPSKDLDAWIRLDDPRRKRILLPLCKRRGILKDYKFISTDLSFLKRYPHIVNEQECAWSAREMTIRESLKMCSTVAQKTKNSTRPNVASKGPRPNMTKGRSEQGSEELMLTQSVLGTVFTSKKVRSMQAVVRELRQLAAKYASDRKEGSKLQALSKAAKDCASLSHDELKTSICLVAVDVHGVFVAKPEEKLTLRNVLILLFRQKEPNATLTKQEILAAAAQILKREINDKEYHQAVTEICNSTEDGHLVLKNGDEPL